MLIITVNAIFALIFLWFVPGALRRARLFLAAGWGVLRAETQKPDYRERIESRHAISEAGNFLVGGLFWLTAGLVALGLGIFFIVQALAL